MEEEKGSNYVQRMDYQNLPCCLLSPLDVSMNYVCYWDLTVYTKFTTSDHLKLIETHDFLLFSLYGIINLLIFGSVNNCFILNIIYS